MNTLQLPRIGLIILLSCFFSNLLSAQTNPSQPNILLIIADDLGVDVSNGYQINNLMPTTPHLDNLRETGLTFANAWANPKCTPTRATIMSGKYGVKTGVEQSPGNLDPVHTSIFKQLSDQTNNAYSDAVFGKWHISAGPVDYNHPAQLDIDHYEGSFSASVNAYDNWEKTTNGVQSQETEYVTTHLTNGAIDWVNAQNQPWFLWLAHVAPHNPIHIPHDSLYTTSPVNNNTQKFIAMIEAMDHEIGRLFDNIPSDVLNNTIIIYIGDNGTSPGVIQNFPSDHAKSTLYQGGVHVPLIVSGAGVSRQNEVEPALVHATDIYATILEVAGANLPGGIHNSMSFHHMLSSTGGPSRPFNYVDLNGAWAIRDVQYKLIEFEDGSQAFFDLINDPLETTNLIDNLTSTQQITKEAFEAEAEVIQNGWSCQDLIQNGVETSIDTNCDVVCTDPNSTSYTNIGCCLTPTVTNIYTETVCNGTRTIHTNNFPNHDYCYANNNNIPAPQYYTFEMAENPALINGNTSITTSNGNPDYYYGVALNGVMLAPAPATPFIFENPETGEYNWDWVFEPTNNQGSGPGKVGLDCASAHTGPQGYHYHGNMFEYAEVIQAGISTTNAIPSSAIQMGWAADGFPIVYRFGPNANGNMALLQPSYQLKAGDRPGDGITAPCGPYNGKYTNDYEYIQGIGDLDECNGIEQSITLNTANGIETFDYFYVITDSFPQIGRCHSGARDLSFDNANNGGAAPVHTPIPVKIKVFLEGAYSPNTNLMRTDLVNQNLLPLSQPYSQAPFNYSGTETITSFNAQMVDWVLIEQRSGIKPETKIETKAGILMEDGNIKDVNGNDLTFNFFDNTGAYFVIRHRNHLDVMTASAAGCDGIVDFDLTNDAAQAYGPTQLKTLGNGTTVLFTGDISADFAIQTTDYDSWTFEPAVLDTYNHNDLNLDGTVQASDYDLWYINKAKLAPSELAY